MCMLGEGGGENLCASAEVCHMHYYKSLQPDTYIYNIHVSFPYTQCNTANDAKTLLSPLLSATVTQAQGLQPIHTATGYTFKRIVVDQVMALNKVLYDVLFIAASSGSKHFRVQPFIYIKDNNILQNRPTSPAKDDLCIKQSRFAPVHQQDHPGGDRWGMGGPDEPLHLPA